MSVEKQTALYCRVAHRDDVRMQEQVQKLRAIADKEGLDNLRVYRDNGVSGLTLERPGMLDLIRDARAGQIDAVVVCDNSRVARNFIEFARFLSILDHYDVRFICPDFDAESAVDWAVSDYRAYRQKK
jgi:DNA invertase Pin-like site-specific DNA recombinase